MECRELGRTGWKVSAISFGAWAIGGSWGDVNDDESLAALRKAIDLGVNFIDTADVYGDGRSERLVGQVQRERKEKIYIATKAGRRLNPHTAAGYNKANLTAFVERSLKNLGSETIDLLQLHCPPTEVYSKPETYGALDDLVRAGKLRHYGVSVQTIDEAMAAMEFPNVQSVQMIFNMFRQRPAEMFFEKAKQKKVGILARVPLASGMLTGKLTTNTKYPADDHRNYNRLGEAFDRGETFSGVEYETGLKAVDELRAITPAGMSMTQFALRWILMFDAVTCAVPGAKRPAQSEENFSAADSPPISAKTMRNIKNVYDRSIRPLVHQYW